MYSLTFNGEFELEYPNEFIAELEELMEKHDCEFYGKTVLQNLGTYVDFQKIEDAPEVIIEDQEKTSDEKV